MLGIPQLLQREGLPFLVHTGSCRRGIPLSSSRHLKRKPGNFPPQPYLLLIAPNILAVPGMKRILILLVVLILLGKQCFPPWALVPKKESFHILGTQRDLTSQGSEPRLGCGRFGLL